MLIISKTHSQKHLEIIFNHLSGPGGPVKMTCKTNHHEAQITDSLSFSGRLWSQDSNKFGLTSYCLLLCHIFYHLANV